MDSSGSRQGPVFGSCECGDDSRNIKAARSFWNARNYKPIEIDAVPQKTEIFIKQLLRGCTKYDEFVLQLANIIFSKWRCSLLLPSYMYTVVHVYLLS
jgi:hypothetical protein